MEADCVYESSMPQVEHRGPYLGSCRQNLQTMQQSSVGRKTENLDINMLAQNQHDGGLHIPGPATLKL